MVPYIKGRSPACHHWGPDSIPLHFMWNFLVGKWQWGRISPHHLSLRQRYIMRDCKLGSPKVAGSQGPHSYHRRTMVHSKCNAPPWSTSLYRQAHREELQHYLPPPDSTAPQLTDATADPRTLLPSAAQAQAPTGPTNYRIVTPQWTPAATTSPQRHTDTAYK